MSPHRGLINAVLRSASRALAEGSFPDAEALIQPESSGRDLVRGLAIAHSHPNWMVTRWLRQFGREGTARLLECNNEV